MNIAFHTLGCKLNFSETSFIANDLKNHGFNEVEFNEIADVYVINTCTVTENANKECRYLVRKVLKQNKNARIIIMGCYAQLKPEEIKKIQGYIEQKGLTIVPLKIYFNDQGRAKLEIAVARGKKLYDKRETEKKRDWDRNKQRLLKKEG